MVDMNGFESHYEDMAPRKLKTRKGGKDIKKMSNNTKADAPSKASNGKKYQKSRGEHAKDILIAILITGVIAFVLGMQFSSGQQARIDNAVKSAQISAESVKK